MRLQAFTETSGPKKAQVDFKSIRLQKESPLDEDFLAVSDESHLGKTRFYAALKGTTQSFDDIIAHEVGHRLLPSPQWQSAPYTPLSRQDATQTLPKEQPLTPETVLNLEGKSRLASVNQAFHREPEKVRVVEVTPGKEMSVEEKRILKEGETVRQQVESFVFGYGQYDNSLTDKDSRLGHYGRTWSSGFEPFSESTSFGETRIDMTPGRERLAHSQTRFGESLIDRLPGQENSQTSYKYLAYYRAEESGTILGSHESGRTTEVLISPNGQTMAVLVDDTPRDRSMYDLL